MFNFKLFEAGSLGRAASPKPPRWAIRHTIFSAGVLGTARSRGCGPDAGRGRDAEAPWGDESRVGGVEEREEHYGFMHNVEMWGWGNWWRRVLGELLGRADLLVTSYCSALYDKLAIEIKANCAIIISDEGFYLSKGVCLSVLLSHPWHFWEFFPCARYSDRLGFSN